MSDEQTGADTVGAAHEKQMAASPALAIPVPAASEKAAKGDKPGSSRRMPSGDRGLSSRRGGKGGKKADPKTYMPLSDRGGKKKDGEQAADAPPNGGTSGETPAAELMPISEESGAAPAAAAPPADAAPPPLATAPSTAAPVEPPPAATAPTAEAAQPEAATPPPPPATGGAAATEPVDVSAEGEAATSEPAAEPEPAAPEPEPAAPEPEPEPEPEPTREPAPAKVDDVLEASFKAAERSAATSPSEEALASLAGLSAPIQNLIEVATFLAFAQGAPSIGMLQLHTAAGILNDAKSRQRVETVWKNDEEAASKEKELAANFTSLPKTSPAREAVAQVERRVKMGEIQALTMLTPEPLTMKPLDEDVEVTLVARVLCKGSASLPPEAAAPWKWPERWGRILKAGKEIDEASFSAGLLAASVAAGKNVLAIRGQLGGHRATAIRAVGMMLRANVSTLVRASPLCLSSALCRAPAPLLRLVSRPCASPPPCVAPPHCCATPPRRAAAPPPLPTTSFSSWYRTCRTTSLPPWRWGWWSSPWRRRAL